MTRLWLPREYGRVAVVMGGRSSERDISLISGKAVLESLQRSGVDAVGIDADRTVLDQLRLERADRVFIILHGRDGEDGKLQGALSSMTADIRPPGSSSGRRSRSPETPPALCRPTETASPQRRRRGTSRRPRR